MAGQVKSKCGRFSKTGRNPPDSQKYDLLVVSGRGMRLPNVFHNQPQLLNFETY